MTRANPRLAALKRKVQEERQRRGDHCYNDAHVKRVAIHLTMEEIDLQDLQAAESFQIARDLGLTVDEYLGAMQWLDPQHESMLRRSLS